MGKGFRVDSGFFVDGVEWGIFYNGGCYTAYMWQDVDEADEYIADGSLEFCERKIADLDIEIRKDLIG